MEVKEVLSTIITGAPTGPPVIIGRCVYRKVDGSFDHIRDKERV